MINGKAIRREAWKLSKERRWPLVRLSLLANVPVFITLLLSLLYRTFSKGGMLPQWVSWPFSIVSQVLSLGLFMVAFRYVNGDDDAPNGLFLLCYPGEVWQGSVAGHQPVGGLYGV